MRRIPLLCLLTALVLSPTTLVAPAANAAWETVTTIDSARLQVCKVPLGDGRFRLKVRLDNTRADHTHLGGVSRTRGGHRVGVDVRAAAGTRSAVQNLVVRRGDHLSGGVGEVTGEGGGGDFLLGQLPRC